MAVVSYKDTVRRVLKTPMRKTFSVVGVTMLVLTLFVMGAIRPTLKTISSLRQEIKERETADANLQEKINTLTELQKRNQELGDSLEVIDLYFPSDMDYSLVMASLEEVTKRYGFTMTSLGISESKTGTSSYANMGRVEISIGVTGRMSNLTKLMRHIEGLPIVPNMMSVSYSPSKMLGDESEIPISLRIYTYRTME